MSDETPRLLRHKPLVKTPVTAYEPELWVVLEGLGPDQAREIFLALWGSMVGHPGLRLDMLSSPELALAVVTLRPHPLLERDLTPEQLAQARHFEEHLERELGRFDARVAPWSEQDLERTMSSRDLHDKLIHLGPDTARDALGQRPAWEEAMLLATYSESRPERLAFLDRALAIDPERTRGQVARLEDPLRAELGAGLAPG